LASAVSHFVIGVTLALPLTGISSIKKTVRPLGLMFTAGVLAVAPDIDTVFYGIIPYAHFLGHRGFVHSPFFSFLIAVVLSSLLYAIARDLGFRAFLGITAAFTLALASHGILDAMTDAGLGVMLLYPYSEERLFLPWRPFYAPPIKISSLSYSKVLMMIKSELPIVLVCVGVAGTIRLALGLIDSKRESADMELQNKADD
jgi:inner membrane protein